MEALAAVSLTGNILQFVEFGGTVISRARQYHASINGRLQSHIELDDTINDFDKLLLKLRSPRVTGGDNASVEAAIGDVLQRRLDESISVGKEMREALDKVRIEGRKTLWKSTRKAIRMVWSEPRLAELQTRLDSIRRGLELVITIEQRYNGPMPFHIADFILIRALGISFNSLRQGRRISQRSWTTLHVISIRISSIISSFCT